MDKKYTFNELCEIISTLRSDRGCPWDREQTKESLKQFVLEECYEVMEACEIGGAKLADELGDLLLQIMLLSQISSEEGSFDISDVISAVSRKMIYRHPHVFGDVTAENSEEVLSNWDKLKLSERGITTHTQSLKDVTSTLPALMKAYKVQHKASKLGFDWDSVYKAIEKLEEEIEEVTQAYEAKNAEELYKETGDMLFAAVNISRFFDVNPELALNDCTKKFISRFEYIETTSNQNGKRLEDMTLDEMDALWDEAKLLEKQKQNQE